MAPMPEDSADHPAELATLRAEMEQLRDENARLLRLLQLSPRQAQPPGPAQLGFFESRPGAVHAGSAPGEKVAFFATLFAARTDVYALRWENDRTGKAGWLPAVRGGWRRGARHEDRDYLPLTAEIITAHLSGEVHLGLYPLLDGDRTWWVALARPDGNALPPRPARRPDSPAGRTGTAHAQPPARRDACRGCSGTAVGRRRRAPPAPAGPARPRHRFPLPGARGPFGARRDGGDLSRPGR
jgi:hypothetical protein